MDKMPCNGWLKQTITAHLSVNAFSIYPSMHFLFIRNSDEYAYLKEKIYAS